MYQCQFRCVFLHLKNEKISNCQELRFELVYVHIWYRQITLICICLFNSSPILFLWIKKKTFEVCPRIGDAIFEVLYKWNSHSWIDFRPTVIGRSTNIENTHSSMLLLQKHLLLFSLFLHLIPKFRTLQLYFTAHENVLLVHVIVNN